MKDYTQYIGIPFVNLGRTKTGADCWGLVRIILEEQYGIILPELLNYNDALDNKQTSQVIDMNKPLVLGEKVEIPEEGCVVIFRTRGVSAHVGLFIGDNMILHTTRQTGAVTEPLSSHRLKNRIEGFYRVGTCYYSK